MSIQDALYPYASIIGLLPAVCGISTIFFVYYTTVSVHQHLPDWLWMPVISLLGCAEPESTYYQIGFATTGLSTLLFFFTFQRSILAHIPDGAFGGEKAKLKWTVLFCAIGVAGQGVVTMEESAIRGITGTRSEGQGEIGWQPGAQSVVHQLLAAMFFGAAMFHGWTAIQVYFRCEQGPIARLWLSKYFKAAVFGFPLVFQFAAFVYHPISGGTKTQNELNKAGLAQWITVFSYLAFFASYAVDHVWIQAILKEQNQDPKKSE